MKTLAEFAPPRSLHLLDAGEVSPAPVCVLLVLPANCNQLLGLGLTKMSPQKVLKMWR